MQRITLIKCDDGKIWVTSDLNSIGTESSFKEITDENDQFLIALCDFLGYDAGLTLNLDNFIGE